MLSRTVERASREEYTPAASVKKYRLDADRPGERPFVSDIYCVDPLAQVQADISGLPSTAVKVISNRLRVPSCIWALN